MSKRIPYAPSLRKKRQKLIEDQLRWIRINGETPEGYHKHQNPTFRTEEESHAIYHSDMQELARFVWLASL